MKLSKAIATVAGLTGVSRIAGFTRDIMTAAFLGAGPVADAFFVALKLPNFFRRVTAEGAFSVSFVPIYSAEIEKHGDEEGAIFAGQAFLIMALLLSVFTIVMIAVMPWIVYLIAPGFNDDPLRYELAIELARTTFPYLLLMSLTALVGGVLNAHDRFAPFAAAPIFFNLTLILFLVLSLFMFETVGHALALGVLASGFVQLGLLWWFLKRARIPIKLNQRPRLTPRIKKLFRLMGPGVIGAGVVHINLFADVIIGSLLDTGAISYLYYADRLNQLPLGLVGIAVGTALLPMLSKSLAAANATQARHLFNRAMEASFLLALPAATGLFMIALPIVTVLFQRGAFDGAAAQQTAAVITAYAIGLPAYIAGKVYMTAYWAQQDTTTPVKASIIATIVNIALSLWFVFYLDAGVAGIAFGTSCAGWLQLYILRHYLRGHDLLQLNNGFLKTTLKLVLSCAAMAIYLYLAKDYLAPWYSGADATFIYKVFALLILVGGGAIIYGGGVLLTQAAGLSDMKQYFKKNNVKNDIKSDTK